MDEGDGPVVRVTVTPGRAAYVRFRLGVFWRRYGWAAVPLGTFAAAVGLLALAALDNEEPPRLAAQCIGGGVLLAVGPAAVEWVAARWAWGRSPELQAERVFEFSADGIAFASAFGSGRIEWAIVQRVRVVAEQVALFAGQGLAYVVPESALTAEQRGELDELLREHVPGFGGLRPRA